LFFSPEFDRFPLSVHDLGVLQRVVVFELTFRQLAVPPDPTHREDLGIEVHIIEMPDDDRQGGEQPLVGVSLAGDIKQPLVE
jgi:hypothetical protein